MLSNELKEAVLQSSLPPGVKSMLAQNAQFHTMFPDMIAAWVGSMRQAGLPDDKLQPMVKFMLHAASSACVGMARDILQNLGVSDAERRLNKEILTACSLGIDLPDAYHLLMQNPEAFGVLLSTFDVGGRIQLSEGPRH